MSVLETYKVTFDLIKKRIAEHNMRLNLAIFISFISMLTLLFSILPLIPIEIMLYFKFDLLYVWLSCVIVFSFAFLLSNKLIIRVNQKYGTTLEEKMFLLAYESLRFLEEYMNPEHRITSSRSKAGKKLERIFDLLNSPTWQLPNIYMVREEGKQLFIFRSNLKRKLIPAIEKISPNRDKDLVALEASHSALQEIVEYLAQPQLSGLKKVNEQMQPLEETIEKGIMASITRGIARPSNLRYLLAFFSVPVSALITYYADLDFFGAKPSEAFPVGLGTSVAVIAIYVTYFATIQASKPKS